MKRIAILPILAPLLLALPPLLHAQELLWTAPVPSKIVGAPVLGGDGVVYVACQDGFLRSYDTEGELSWEFELLKPPIGQMAKYQGVLYVHVQEHALQAVHATGSGMWEFRVSPDIIGDPAVTVEGRVALVAEDTFLYFVDVDGALLWKTPLAGDPSTGPVIGADGMIYTACEGALEAFNQSGNRKWVYPLPGHAVAPLALGPNGELLVLDENGQLQRVSRHDSANDWRLTGVASSISPVVSWERVYVLLDEGGVRGYGLLTGEEEWTAGLYGSAAPALDASGLLYVPDLPNEAVSVVDTNVRAREGWFRFRGEVDLSLDGQPGSLALYPVMGEGLLVVATDAKTLYCYRVDQGPGSEPWHQLGGTALRQNRRDEAPTLTLAGISDGETVSGTVEIVADVRDDLEQSLTLRYFLDGSLILTQRQAPWTFDWNTEGVINGQRDLLAEVSDMAGNKAALSLRVTVQNTPAGPFSFYADDPPRYFEWEQGTETHFRMEFARDAAFAERITTSRDGNHDWLKTPNWRPSAKKWKKILSIAKNGPDADVSGYWRIIGKRTGPILAGEYIVKAPTPCLPVEPVDGYAVPEGRTPGFRWHMVHNQKFQVEFSTSGDFSTGVAVSSKTPNNPWVKGDAWGPSPGRWAKVLALGTRVYWRVRCKDSLKRITYSGIRVLELSEPGGRACSSALAPGGLLFLTGGDPPSN